MAERNNCSSFRYQLSIIG